MKQKIKSKALRAKRKELIIKNMKQSTLGMKLYALCLMLCAICFMFFAFLGCATVTTTGEVKGSMETQKLIESPVITGIDIQDYAVSITANKPFTYTIYRPGDPYKIVIDIPDVDVGAFNSRIVSDKAGITEIVPSQIKSPSFIARLEMLLHSPSIIEQEYKNNVLIVKIKEEPPKEVSKEELIPTKVEQPGEIEEVKIPEPVTTPTTSAIQSEEQKLEIGEVKETEILVKDRCQAYLGGKENINFDFQDQDIVPIFRLFADISGCNLFIHPDVKGKATMKFRDVPWNQALDTILKTFSLGKSVEGNIIRIAPLTVFAKESEDATKAMEAEIKAEPLATRVFPISYAKVKDIETALKNSKILTPRGSLNVDERTSTLIINDTASVFPEVEKLLVTLDKPTPQVLIEARIVEVNTSEVKDLGIQWGAFFNSTNTLTSIGGYSGLTTGTFTGENFLVDFPGGAAAGSGSGFTFGILNPTKTLGLDLQLAAVETLGKGKVVSNPKIMTVDNEEAKIAQGKSIPVRKYSPESGTTSTEFKDVTLDLSVKPHITPNNSVSMLIEIKKEELDPTIPSIEGVPGTDKKEAKTNVIIKDGETIVIGGIYKINKDVSETGVPGLMKIPILGWLFKNYKENFITSELLIFITPRIVQKQ